MKTALVLGGGGSKGAYEIGVWKALREQNITFDLVTGTSIGAMIGAMIVQDDYEKCVELWEHISVDQVIKDGVNLDFDLDLLISQKQDYKAFLASCLEHKGVDITPFYKMVDSMFDETKFFSSAIDYGCMCVNVSKREPIGKQKKDMKDGEEAKEYIMASASCFPAFPMKKIGEEYYIDGGYYDNVPIQLAKEMGAELIIAVDLKAIGRNQLKHSQKDLIYIEPHVSLGSFLKFDSQLVKRNMRLGYLDTLKQFHQYLGYIYTYPLCDNKAIIEMEQTMEEFFSTFHISFSFEKMNVVYQKAVERKIQEKLKDFQDHNSRFLYLLELGAFEFGIDDETIRTFSEFCDCINDELKAYQPPYEATLEHLAVKEILIRLKQLSHKDLIYYIYMKLVRPKKERNLGLETCILLFTEEFLIAYMLFFIRKP